MSLVVCSNGKIEKNCEKFDYFDICRNSTTSDILTFYPTQKKTIDSEMALIFLVNLGLFLEYIEN